MTEDQISEIQKFVDAYFQIDISDLVSTAFHDINENTPVIGQYTCKEFVSLSNKIFNQFREELKTPYSKALPYQYQFQNEFGGGNLNNDLSYLNSYILNSDFGSASSYLNRLIHYQAVNGFWEKNKRKYFRHSEEVVNNEKERIELVSKQLEKATNELKNILIAISDAKSDLSFFTESKRKELSEIESLLNSARNHSEEINNHYVTSNTNADRINTFLSDANSKKQEIDNIFSNSKETLNEIGHSQKEYEKHLIAQDKERKQLKSAYEEQLKIVEEKVEYFEKRNEYLDDLIGREVGASLFETFKQRKGELSTNISFWKWSVPVASIASIVWIFFLFGAEDLTSVSWQLVFINTLKASPAIGLLLFAISQYTKERNFQEEYAFKSAVALTVNSYADKLNTEENKDKLVMDSVSAIYKSPLSSKPIKDPEIKTLTETAKELTNVAKSLISSK